MATPALFGRRCAGLARDHHHNDLIVCVFTFGSLLVAIQVAGGQLTPRVIATTLLRDNVVRYTVGLFVFTLLFAISALNRIKGTGDQLVLFVAGLLGLLSMAAFLYLIDYAARLLRPVSILSRVGEDGLTVIEAVYPQPTRSIAAAHQGSDYWDAFPDRSSCR
jgi:Predicted membrane protein